MIPALPISKRSSQSVIGLGLAFVIFGSWLTVHLYAMFSFALTWVSLPFALGLAVLQCWLSVGLFIVSHDAMHGSLAPGRPTLNSAVGATLLILYAGFGWRKIRDAHFDHHRKPGSDEDPDFDAENPRNFGRWYMTFIRRYFGWKSAAYISGIVAMYWLVFGVPLEKIVLLFGLPAIASSLQLFYFGTFRPHRHGAAEFADRHNARSESFGVIASLASCFHFGYHNEHHHRPDLPWWALPQARRATLARDAGS